MAQVLEHLLSINKFNRPIDLTDEYAIHNLLIRLILLEPGTFETHPDLGVGLLSRYRFNDTDSINQLKSDIKNQIRTYLPEFQTVEVNIVNKDKGIGFSIKVDETMYNFIFDKDTQKISDL